MKRGTWIVKDGKKVAAFRDDDGKIHEEAARPPKPDQGGK